MLKDLAMAIARALEDKRMVNQTGSWNIIMPFLMADTAGDIKYPADEAERKRIMEADNDQYSKWMTRLVQPEAAKLLNRDPSGQLTGPSNVTHIQLCGFVPPTPGYAPCVRAMGHEGPCAHHLKD